MHPFQKQIFWASFYVRLYPWLLDVIYIMNGASSLGKCIIYWAGGVNVRLESVASCPGELLSFYTRGQEVLIAVDSDELGIQLSHVYMKG